MASRTSTKSEEKGAARGRVIPEGAGLPREVKKLFARRGWEPFEFQIQAWRAYLKGGSGLINAPTGFGKTWAAWLGVVIEGLAEGAAKQKVESEKKKANRAAAVPVRAIWITPLRALASDTGHALLEPVRELGLNWTVELRTGDTAQSLKKKQREQLPTALVTTPESLTLLLSYPEARERFTTLRCVIVDEWHELIGTKRGAQTELALARLRAFVPGLRTWGVSATLGNLAQARDVLAGASDGGCRMADVGKNEPALIRGQLPKELDIRTIIPKDIERFPWAGHLGTRCVEQVIETIRGANSTLLFTNTRSQAELWFRRLIVEAPDLLGSVAIHHGSLDRKLRGTVEGMLAEGRLKCVVCTSSLDLGVDFAPVDQVLQVGSPKGIARLMQRAGRSGHQPGAKSRVLGVPAHAFELVEFAAAREAAAAGKIESRVPVELPMDVLVQHLVTMACAGGFAEDELRAEVRGTYAFAKLEDVDWAWAMSFVRQGGPALTAYPHFARIRQREDGRWMIADDRMARMHRMSIGTITAESSMSVKYMSGRTLGHIEEGFIARLPVGAKFVFAGKVLEIVRVRDMSVLVQRARSKTGIVPRWDGGRFSLSTQLSAAVRAKLEEASRGVFESPEMRAVRPLMELQAMKSRIPRPDELLVETVALGRVHNVFLFPFQGRQAHEGMGALLAYRWSRKKPISVTSTVNDYGIGLSSDEPMRTDEQEWRALLSTEGLLDDLLACLNASNLARRQFRDIARIAGLVLPGFPGTPKPSRHLQASSEMFFDVFEEFDPDNLLMSQARREVLESQLELARLRAAMEAAGTQKMVMVAPDQLTPLSFPIWAENLRATTLSSEKWADMVRKMVVELEHAGDEQQQGRGAGKRRGGAAHGRSRKRMPR